MASGPVHPAYGAVSALRKLASAAIDLVWPPRSLLSDVLVDAPGRIEPALWAELRFLGPPWCARCGFPFETPLAPGAWCAACLAAPPPFDWACAALAYDDHARRLVLEMKRQGRRDGLPTFAAWMRAAAGPALAAADVLVPVPLHWTRLARRGFNQAAWLAQALAKAPGSAAQRPVLLEGLVRHRMRRSQAGLSATGRRRNAAGAYAAPERARAALEGRRVVLIDDVYTTGATLAACARALRRAGAAEIGALTLARVVRPVAVAI
ncbi:MAG: ComF family protein [Alphaproteobacteria bacterium]|nr:ComF family protein [Alphaproteobacteria bacterium]